jgi:hypothetical protein
MRARLWISAVCLLIAVPAVASAQAVTGSLEGRILSTQGEPLQDAVVTVSSPFLQGTREATTDQRGRFLLLWLPAGTSTVQLRRVGFGPVAMPGVRIGLGVTTSLGDVRLEPQALVLPAIVVSGARPLFDPTRAAAATVLDSSVFLTLPTERNFRALVGIAPQANPSPYGDGVNVSGATGQENGYYVDGVHVTDPLWGDGSVNLPYNFIREVQVTTGGYEAEYGRTQGGVVNVITNSGGNEWHGQVLGFFTGDALRATPRWGVGQTQVETFSQYDVGGSLGGPIRRDRLWFYVAYNPSFERHDASYPGITTQQDVRTTHLFAGKLTGRLGTSTDFTLTLLGDPSRRDAVGASPSGVSLPATVTDPRAVLGKLFDGGVAVALQARHRFGDAVFLAWSLAQVGRRQDNTPRAGPLTDMATLARIDDHVTNTASGNYGFSQETRLARTAGQASVSVLAGSHLVKLGAEFEVNTIAWDLFSSSLSRDLDSVGLPIYSWLQVTQHYHARNAIPSLYAEDSWEVGPRLRLSLGVRVEGQFVSGDTGTARRIAPEIAPRFGVVYQPGELGTHKVYASVGRFYEQMPLWSVGYWVGLYSLAFATYPQDPLVDSTGGTGWTYSQVGEPTDQNIRGQYYDEVTAGYDRRLGSSYRVGLRGTFRALRWVVEDGAPDPSSPFIVGNPGRGAMAYLPRASRDYAALELTLERSRAPLTFLVSYALSRNRGNYTGLFTTDALALGANSGPQFDFPDQLVNAMGPLPNDRTHVVKFVGSYRLSMGLTVGTSALLASGAPLSEYGTGPGGYTWTFVRPRGVAGRTPTTWDVDLRFAYDLPVTRGARVRPRMLLDVLNVGNQRRPLTYDQRHYTTPDQSGVNPNYGAVTQYQAPLNARLGMVVDF